MRISIAGALGSSPLSEAVADPAPVATELEIWTSQTTFMSCRGSAFGERETHTSIKDRPLPVAARAMHLLRRR